MKHEKKDPAEPAAPPLDKLPQTAYRGDNRIARARVWLPFVAVLAMAIYWAAEYCGRGDVRYTPGPLANVHVTWDDNCSVCHTGAAPLGGNNWVAATTGLVQTEEQCKTCHPGPAHHEQNERLAEVPRCATCHREHRGRHTPLTRMPDAFCTSCHRDLSKHVQQGKTTDIADVTGFGNDQHPPFREWQDPGKIAFNHKLHMEKTVSKADGMLVQLQCDSCHRTEGRDASPELRAGLPQNAIRRARSDGATMQPILYELHCQECHPLTIKRTVKADEPAGDVTVRHRMQPAELHEVLRGYYTERFLAGRLKVSPAFLKIPLPGKNPLRDEEKRTAAEIIAQYVRADTMILFGASTCQKCHPSLSHDRGRIPSADIPQVWFQRARFDHAAHRAVDCLQCHNEAKESAVSADVLLPGIATCQQCHAPPSRSGITVRGGARFDCVECHRYHNGDQPLQGKGAAARQPAADRKVGIEKFMTGPMPVTP